MNARRSAFCLALSILVVGLAGPEFTAGRQGVHRDPKSATVTIDTGKRFQTMEGFGSTQRAWSDPHVADMGPPPDIPPSVQARILTQLYTELGLSRVRIFDGHGFEDRMAYVRQARTFGLASLISVTDPNQWIDPEQHANNTMALLLRWRDWGMEPQYQTLMNEPAARPWADGPWHLQAIRMLGPRMRAAGLRTMMMIPDDLNSCAAIPIARMVLEDVVARRYVGALAYHMYGGDDACLKEMKSLSLRYGVPVWMTEYSWEPDFAGSLNWAKQIHELIVNYNVSAVDYMWGFFGDRDMQRVNKENLIQVAFGPDGRYLNHRRTSKYYFTGQFSRFIPPGSIRVEASSTTSEVLVSAYRGNGKVIIVAINDRSGQVEINVDVKGLLPTRSFTAVRTSHGENLKELAPLPLRGSGFRATLPGKSVTTFVTALE